MGVEKEERGQLHFHCSLDLSHIRYETEYEKKILKSDIHWYVIKWH